MLFSLPCCSQICSPLLRSIIFLPNLHNLCMMIRCHYTVQDTDAVSSSSLLSPLLSFPLRISPVHSSPVIFLRRRNSPPPHIYPWHWRKEKNVPSSKERRIFSLVLTLIFRSLLRHYLTISKPVPTLRWSKNVKALINTGFQCSSNT